MHQKSIRSLVLLLAVALILQVSGGAASRELNSGITVSDLNKSIFGDRSGRIELKPLDGYRALRLVGGRVERPRVSASQIMTRRTAHSVSPGMNKKKMTLSIICSAILPGLGELYLYTMNRNVYTLARVPAFFALEGYLWYGYHSNHKKGKDIKEEFREYADAHWNLERFLEQHPCCVSILGCEDYLDYNNNCQGKDHFFLYTPREIDEEEYYENVGKYDAFVYGWDDWSDQADFWTQHRRKYWSMRDESDNYLIRGDQYLMMLLVNRVLSMIDTAWLAYRIGRNGDEGGNWSLQFQTGSPEPALAVGYRF